ncbi:MAG: hypothetical protein ACI9QD_000405 [Thermoproteota archaeon]|jgi:hypothetical protein
MDSNLLREIRSKLPLVGRSLEGNWGSEALTNYKYFFKTHRDSYTHLSLNVENHMDCKWKDENQKNYQT